MNDELLGQDEQLKKQFKSDIRQAWDVTDVFDSELEDAGGLNNEGLQLEVTDRGIATRQHDLTTGPLDELAKLIGLTDYRVTFIPPQDTDVEQRQAKVDLGQSAADAGLDARWEDDEVEIADGDFEEQESGDEGGGFFSEDGDEDGGGPEELFGDFSDGELEKLATKLSEGYEHIVWAEDADQKANPFWDEDERVPAFIAKAIEEVIEKFDVVHDGLEGLTASQNMALKDLFREKLTQPQGWSLGSISDDIQDILGVSADKAETWARTESARILNTTREKAYEKKGDTEDALFKWVGPADDRTTDACEWLKKQTADGVTMERLKELAKEASDKFFPDLKYSDDWIIHPHERHTFVTAHKAKFGAAPAPGTFAPVNA